VSRPAPTQQAWKMNLFSEPNTKRDFAAEPPTKVVVVPNPKYGAWALPRVRAVWRVTRRVTG
jgi:hypothetical protein